MLQPSRQREECREKNIDKVDDTTKSKEKSVEKKVDVATKSTEKSVEKNINEVDDATKSKEKSVEKNIDKGESNRERESFGNGESQFRKGTEKENRSIKCIILEI